MSDPAQLWLIEDYMLEGSEVAAIIAQWPLTVEVTPTQAMVEAVQSRMGSHVRQRKRARR